MSTAFAQIRRFGEVSIDLESRIVSRGGDTARLEPKAAAVLRALLDAGRAPVSRERLLDLCWEQGSGSDEALTQAVAQIRRALDDDPASPRFIVTVPKLGYRWLAPTAEPSEAAAQPAKPKGRLLAATIMALLLGGALVAVALTPIRKEVEVVKVYKDGSRSGGDSGTR